MKEIVLIAGTCFQEAAGAAEWFRQRGAVVIEMTTAADAAELAGALETIQAEGKLDYLIVQATHRGENVQPLGQLDDQDISRVFDLGVNGTHALVEKMLPFLRQGKKRLGLITSAATSTREPKETKDFAFAMTQAGLHMLWKLYFNKLRPEGFTFRVFCPNEDGSGLCAGQYMHMDFCYDVREEYIHSEENRIVMRDGMMREISW
ncbi:MAG: SDR family NAD(P)-dependent oxidoreductase [Clostridiales bacterium]|nr:SDR family NAD(P)-dependent oxidoreductase [Clostridiales bacterium]